MDDRDHEALLGALSEGVVGLTARGRIAYANQRASQLLGIPASDLEGKTWSDLRLVSLPGSEQTTPFTTWAHEVAGQDGVQVVRRVSSGAAQSLTSRLRTVEGAGPVRYLFVFWRSSHLQMADEQLRQVLDHAADMIASLDRRLDIRLFNCKMETTLGWSREEVLFKPFASLVAKGSRAEFRDLMRQAFRDRGIGPGPAMTTLMLARKDGGEIPAEVSVSVTTHHGRARATLVMRDVSAQRRKMAHALSEVELLRIVLESMHEGILVFGPDDRLVTFNRHFTKMLGMPDGRIRNGMLWDDMIRLVAASGIYGPLAPEYYLARTREELTAQFEYQDRQLADGRWLSTRRSRLPDGGFVATYRDVTRRRMEQEKLADAMAAVQHSADTSSAILGVLSSGMAIAVLDRDGLITEHNEAWDQFAAAHGMTVRASWKGKSFLEACARADGPFVANAPAIVREFGAILDGARERFTIEYSLEQAGEPGYYVLDIAPMGLEFIEGAVVRIEDVTESKRTALKAEEARKHLEAIVENSGDAIIMLNVEGRIEAANGTTCDMFGYDRESLVGEPIHRILPAFPFFCSAAGFEGSVPAKFHDEIPGVHRDGQNVLVDLMMSRVPHTDAEGFVLNLRDMTDYRTMQEQLHQTSKLAVLGEMAAGMAHELNQPLSVMRMAADNALIRMERGKADPEYITEAFSLISDQAGKLGKTILNLRTFARREQDAERATFNPCNAADAACQLLRARLALHSISLDLHMPEFCHNVRGNEISLEQVLINLIGNASDAILARRKKRAVDGDYVRVTVSDDGGDLVTISVEDSGGGISENTMPKIFNPFFTTKTVGEGTGLGLSISYGIVTNMGGTITARNTLDGARFEIAFPAAAEDDGAARPDGASGAASPDRTQKAG